MRIYLERVGTEVRWGAAIKNEVGQTGAVAEGRHAPPVPC
jgi:hypothetical protein